MFSDLSRPPLAGAGGRLRAPAGWEVHVVAETGSTNSDLVELVRRGVAGPGYVLAAEYQRAGRGRLDRAWSSPPRAGLQVSAVLSTPPSPWVPLLAGVAVARTIREVCRVEARLKWPNDVLLGGRKVCGILAEVVPGVRPSRVVLGVGLNVTTTREELPAGRPATSLALEGAAVTDRATLLRALLRHLGDTAGPVDYLALCATVGSRVAVHVPGGGVVEGEAESVDEHGRLVVDGTPFAAGDVVHLR